VGIRYGSAVVGTSEIGGEGAGAHRGVALDTDEASAILVGAVSGQHAIGYCHSTGVFVADGATGLVGIVRQKGAIGQRDYRVHVADRSAICHRPILAEVAVGDGRFAAFTEDGATRGPYGPKALIRVNPVERCPVPDERTIREYRIAPRDVDTAPSVVGHTVAEDATDDRRSAVLRERNASASFSESSDNREAFEDRIGALAAVEQESTGLRLTVDLAAFRATGAADRDGLAFEIDLTIARPGVRPVRHDDRIAIDRRIDPRLDIREQIRRTDSHRDRLSGETARAHKHTPRRRA